LSAFPNLSTQYLLSDLGPRFALPLCLATLARRSNPPQVVQKAIKPMIASHCSHSYAPVCSDFVTHGCILHFLATKNLDFGAHLSACFGQDETSDLVLELLFLLVASSEWSQRILVRLAEAENAEPDVWARDDYRIAWLTVLYCANGRPTPWEWAFNRVVGGHASKVIPQLVARAEKDRLLGLPPKKSVVSTRKQTREKHA
jgi:hypothetical protein